MSKLQAYKIILSDLDGVIRTYPQSHSEAIEFEFGLSKDILLRTAFQSHLLEQAISGKISDEYWRDQIVIDISKIISPDDARKAVDKWSEFPGALQHNVMNLLKSYKNKCRLTMLTNATTKLKKDLQTLGIFEEFEVIFNTSEIGYAKPDKCVFEFVIQKLKCSPSEILFIDDRLENIETAQTLGMQVHHFTKFEELKRTLDKN